MRIPFTKVFITRFGIDFSYKDESIWYVWRWGRKDKSHKFISYAFEAGFPTLKDLDKEWEEYRIACRKTNEKEV